ncbi:MAG: histidine--tRNA ligase [Amoebophilaceae bacterium]|nr:histidine--tRNA ligase [Amoebophilaceae bacterium]
MIILPHLVKGMRDRTALEIYRRNYIISTIQSIYACYGFEPLETPALESRATLTGKYGAEGEQLIFSVLKSGDFTKEVEQKIPLTDYKRIKPYITDKGLRYDLTVPLVRYIAANQQLLTFPFRRYQIQPVWRADRPQKGRYREFLQCDTDIIGSSSLLCEAEILKLIYDILVKLGLQHFCIKINHRGILTAISGAEASSEREKIFCTTVDKLEKIGLEKTIATLSSKGFSEQSLQLLTSFSDPKGGNMPLLAQLDHTIGCTASGAKAIGELTEVITQAGRLGLPDGCWAIQPTLARGLAYYTGMVIEITIKDSQIGSIGGGGRYDQLGSLFGIENLCGIGFSFGIDRLYDSMESQGLFNGISASVTDILLINMDAKAESQLLALLSRLRTYGFKAEVYPDRTKLKRQFVYADKKKIPFVVIVGEEELSTNCYSLKNMQTGLQNSYNWPELCQALETSLNIK